MAGELDHYVRTGSPFLPGVDLELLSFMIRDLTLEQGYYVGEAIAKGLGLLGVGTTLNALSTRIHELGITPMDLVAYTRGFTRPFRLLQIAYAEIVEEPGAARAFLDWLPADQERDFLSRYVPFAADVLKGDRSGIQLINEITQKESASATDLYYKVGLEAARQTFQTYFQIVDTIITQEPKKEELPGSLWERLNALGDTPSSSPKPLSKKKRQLEETLAAFAKNPSCSTALFVFLRHPSLIPRFFVLLTRIIYQAYKNPDIALQELRKGVSVIPKMQETARGEWQPGELMARLDPEFATLEESISRVAPPPPYPGKNLVEDIKRICELRECTSFDSNACNALLETWEHLAEQPGLQEYSALWTAIHIELGRYAKEQYALAHDTRFLKLAKRVYATPLKRITWRTDLGTRCLCGARLGQLYFEHGADLGMPASELARAIFDTYSDMLEANERLYQRSPFRESKEKLQGRISLAVARMVEACVYLSERSESEESKHWRRQALMIAENGKSRMLREELAIADRVPPAEIPHDLYLAEKRYLERLREIYATDITHRKQDILLKPSMHDELNKERNELRLELEQTWIQMEEYGESARSYVMVRRDEGVQQWDVYQSVAERLGEKAALVSVIRLPESVCLAVLRAGWDAPDVHIVPLTRDHFTERYLKSYVESMLNRPRRAEPRKAYSWQQLGEEILALLEPLLADAELVYFSPHGPFHRFPLHALTVKGKPFIERWAVAYTPAVSVLESALSRSQSQGAALVMGYDTPDDPAMILAEAEKVARHFHVQPILLANANSTTLSAQSSSARLIHLSCHGKFNPEDPLESGTRLVDGLFTARDWLGLRLQADLVTLSACETGIADIRPGDDLVGLMRAVLFAGASSLLMTLWSVHGPTTHDWMLNFYERVWDERGNQIEDKSAAFQKTTLELRKSNPDPYYWAPFILVGNFQ